MTHAEVERIMKVAFILQYANECIDEVEGDYPWKQELKRTGNVFRRNVDKFLDGILRNVDKEEQENYALVTKALREKMHEAYNEITIKNEVQ